MIYPPVICYIANWKSWPWSCCESSHKIGDFPELCSFTRGYLPMLMEYSADIFLPTGSSTDIAAWSSSNAGAAVSSVGSSRRSSLFSAYWIADAGGPDDRRDLPPETSKDWLQTSSDLFEAVCFAWRSAWLVFLRWSAQSSSWGYWFPRRWCGSFPLDRVLAGGCGRMEAKRCADIGFFPGQVTALSSRPEISLDAFITLPGLVEKAMSWFAIVLPSYRGGFQGPCTKMLGSWKPGLKRVASLLPSGKRLRSCGNHHIPRVVNQTWATFYSYGQTVPDIMMVHFFHEIPILTWNQFANSPSFSKPPYQFWYLTNSFHQLESGGKIFPEIQIFFQLVWTSSNSNEDTLW